MSELLENHGARSKALRPLNVKPVKSLEEPDSSLQDCIQFNNIEGFKRGVLLGADLTQRDRQSQHTLVH